VFTPSRLELARKRRGLTKKGLADRVGVSRRSITGFESGEYAPDSLTVARLADILSFPTAFFEGDDLEEAVPDAASFRSMSKMTAAQRDAALSAGTLAYAFHDWISERFRLPPPLVPQVGPGVDPEIAAEVVRAEWALGEAPISNMVHLLELKGIRVFSLKEVCREVDAFSLWRSGTPYVFLNTQKSSEHSRMDAAHELGHLVMHCHDEIPQGKEAENEARRFASAFLMPRARIRASAPQWPTLTDLIAHKRIWKVSVAALNYRLHQLELVTDWHYRTLCIELAKAGYRMNEPEPTPRESSQVLTKVFAGLRQDGIGKADIAEALDYFPEELDDFVFHLAMLPITGEGTSGKRKATSSPTLTVLKGGAS
jgi:Zn-dependent peptidase ImmA (M78 family)/transcriptional regulator with XRE-family HTH domain